MERVRYERVNGAAALYIDDGKVNTFHADSIAEIDAALTRAENDADAQAVVIIGRPGFFSAGLDLKRLPGLGKEALREVTTSYGRLMLRIFAFPKPTVGVVTGHALAGGAVMLCACDKRVGAEGMWKIGLNEVGIGLVLPTFVLEMAKHVLLPTALTDALLMGRIYDPQGAKAVGYLDEVVEPAEAPERGLAIGAQLASLSPSAYAGTKKNLKGAAAARAGETLERELDNFLSSGTFG